MTSLANNTPYENPYPNTFLDVKFFTCKPIFKMFATHFKTKVMLNYDKIIFV